MRPGRLAGNGQAWGRKILANQAMRRLPPDDNPFRPVRCRDLALGLLMLFAAFWAGVGFLAAWLAGAL